MKKVVKKQLKEDEFVSTMNKIVHFFETRTKEIIIGLCVIAFIALLFVGLRFLQAQNFKKESLTLGQMQEIRSTLSTKPENLAKLEQLAGKGKYGRLAYVLLGTYWIEKGDLAKAKDVLAKVGGTPKDFIYYQAEDLLGKVDTLAKNYDQAIAIYTKLEKDKPKDYTLDVILFHKAEALEGKGDKAGALEVYKKLQQDYPQSYFGYDATERVRKLEGAGQPSL
jgi:predicted negative regulator of RcsB-dependent stress response